VPDGPATSPAERLARLVAEQRDAFRRRFSRHPAVTASAPGRINVIGEHTDYNLGLALPGAIDRWVVVTLALRDDGLMRVHSEAFDETVEIPLAQPPATVRGWHVIPLGAGRLLAPAAGAPQEQGAAVRRDGGFDALIGGNVPRGAGVSSSAAVEMALLNALRGAWTVAADDLELVLTAQRIEHEYLGAPTGLMDQYTSQFGRAGNLMLIDFDAVTHELVTARLDGWVWLLLDSKVRHDLAESGYGERVEQMRAALDTVAAADDRVHGFRDLDEAHVGAIGDPLLRRRALHYVRENERVRAAAVAATAGKTTVLGELLCASHASLRDDYEVSCAELDLLAELAAGADGCVGARMMGGGFGGCTINLVRAAAAGDVVAQVSGGFARRFGYAPDAAVYRLVDGARVHEDDEQP